MESDRFRATLPPGFLATGGPSFTHFLAQCEPKLLPASAVTVAGANADLGSLAVPHGTTIVALEFDGGVVMAGDRRATAGNVIALRDIEKVFAADEYSLIGIAGSAGIAVELVKLFQVELAHYEKIEGEPLSLEGKANRLATMLRGNLGLAMQGLAAVPLFAGYDHRRGAGRIFSYDVTGGRYEERAFHAVGSGAAFARGSLKKLFSPSLERRSAAIVALEALFDAADDDSATGGPDLARKIYPVVGVASADGAEILAGDVVGELLDGIVRGRTSRPDGPAAPVPNGRSASRRGAKP